MEQLGSFATVPFPVSARRVALDYLTVDGFATVPFPVSARHLAAIVEDRLALPQFLFQCRQDRGGVESGLLLALPQFLFQCRQDERESDVGDN